MSRHLVTLSLVVLLLCTVAFSQSLTYSRLDYPMADGPIRVLAADFDKDGRPDLAALTDGHLKPSAVVSIFLATGPGTYGPRTDYATTFPRAQEFQLCDCNRDGAMDVVVLPSINPITGDPLTKVGVMLNNGSGRLGAMKETEIGGSVFGLAVGNINSDGISDVAVSMAQNGTAVGIFLGKGDGTFVFNRQLPVQGIPNQIFHQDLNKDGRSDILVQKSDPSGVAVFLKNVDGSFGPAKNSTIQTGDWRSAIWMAIPTRTSRLASSRPAAMAEAAITSFKLIATMATEPSRQARTLAWGMRKCKCLSLT